MPDKEIVCKACHNPFVFTDGEQAFYEEKGLHEPKRCKGCRNAQKRGEPNAPLPPPDYDFGEHKGKKGKKGRR